MLSPQPHTHHDVLQNLRGPVKGENVLKSLEEFQDGSALDRAWGALEWGVPCDCAGHLPGRPTLHRPPHASPVVGKRVCIEPTASFLARLPLRPLGSGEGR